MEEIINIVTDKILEEIKNTEVKNIVIETKDEITPEQRMIIESIRQLKNPFAMIGVNYVMKDLKICKSIAYKLFQRDDFPSIKFGKEHRVMLLPYLMWKMNKKD